MSTAISEASDYITIKVPYYCPDSDWPDYCEKLQRQQSNAIRIAFNRFKDGLKRPQIYDLLACYFIKEYIDPTTGKRKIDKSVYQSIPTDSFFINSAIMYAEGQYKSSKELNVESNLFGRKGFDKYNRGKISKEQLRKERDFPIYAIGQAFFKGNVKFNFLSFDKIEFKPNIQNHFTFHLNPSINQVKYLHKICELASNCLAPITIILDKSYIYLSFDVKFMSTNPILKVVKKNRVLGIDMNPNSFGAIVKDNIKIYQAIKLDFNDLRSYVVKGFKSTSKEAKHLENKKNHEIIQAAYFIIEQAKAFHCEAISIENLYNMISNTRNRHFNRTVNRDFKKKLFKQTLKKLCIEDNIKFIEISAAYTSFYGAIKYSSILGDPLSAAACVADAGIIELNKKSSQKNQNWYELIQLDKTEICMKNKYLESLELRDTNFSSMKELYQSVKKQLASKKIDMYSSIHISYPATSVVWFKSKSSGVRLEIFKPLLIL